MTFQFELGHMGGAVGLLWVDLETTGTDENKDDIIEIGAVCTSFNLDRIGNPFQSVIVPSDIALGRLMKTHAVRNMHQDNGLLDDILFDSLDGDNVENRVEHIATAEARMLDWLNRTENLQKRNRGGGKVKWMLAGSGVAHFDMRFIRKYMPHLAQRLTFTPLDVGMVRRFLRVSGVELASADNTESKNHRALSDVLLHLEEARVYRDFLQKAHTLINATVIEDPNFVLPN